MLGDQEGFCNRQMSCSCLNRYVWLKCLCLGYETSVWKGGLYGNRLVQCVNFCACSKWFCQWFEQVTRALGTNDSSYITRASRMRDCAIPSSKKDKWKGIAYEDDVLDVLDDDDEEKEENISDDENYTWDGKDA